MSSYLVREKIPQHDKENTEAETWEGALKKIGKEEKDKYNEVSWLNFTDHFFIGTESYIREIKNEAYDTLSELQQYKGEEF